MRSIFSQKKNQLFFTKDRQTPPNLPLFPYTGHCILSSKSNSVGVIMNYVKKMCILRQIRQGFSEDGKALSGLIKAEQYGKNLAVEVSVINFAPLSSGEYYCLLSDGNGKTEMLALRGKSLFNLLSDLDISCGFCGIVCYVKTEVTPISYGINGNKTYDWRAILNSALPPVFPTVKCDRADSEIASAPPPEPAPDPKPEPPLTPQPEPAPVEEEIPPPEDLPPPRELDEKYNDETVATKNYYEDENDERILPEKTDQNAYAESATPRERTQTRVDSAENVDAPRVRRALATDPDGYYLAVKEEIDRLFKTYPRDKTLSGAFSCGEWVRVKGTIRQPEYLVGILRMDGKVRYICYALRAEQKDNPPDEIKNVCAFVPTDFYDENKGYFVIFQSASSGECIRPEMV